MKATSFTLPDENGVNHSLSDYQGKWLLLYFYPKDDTPGCTNEACNFRDALADFEKYEVSLVGISKDSIASHKKFSEKQHLNFPLLSDESGKTVEAYNAWGKKKFMGREYEGILRTTYLINREGEIEKIYENVNPIKHAKEVLEDLEKLSKEDKLNK